MSEPRALLPVRIEGRWLALDATAVIEVLGAKPVLPLPGAPAGLPGVFAWRGRAVAVLDLGVAALGLPAPTQPRSRTVLARLEGTSLALPVDEVREVRLVEPSELRPAHAAPAAHAALELDWEGTPSPVLELAELLTATLGPERRP